MTTFENVTELPSGNWVMFIRRLAIEVAPLPPPVPPLPPGPSSHPVVDGDSFATADYQPIGLPLSSASSHGSRGAKYARSARVETGSPVASRMTSRHGRVAPRRRMARRKSPTGLEP